MYVSVSETRVWMATMSSESETRKGGWDVGGEMAVSETRKVLFLPPGSGRKKKLRLRPRWGRSGREGGGGKVINW